MRQLFIPAQRFTPEVDFSPTLGELTITGVCLPENAPEFFGPLIKWLQDFYRDQLVNPENTKRQLQFTVYLRHLNSVSYRYIGRLFRLFALLHDLHACSIIWQYEPNDYDMQDAGEDLFAVLDLDLQTRLQQGDKPIPIVD